MKYLERQKAARLRKRLLGGRVTESDGLSRRTAEHGIGRSSPNNRYATDGGEDDGGSGEATGSFFEELQRRRAAQEQEEHEKKGAELPPPKKGQKKAFVYKVSIDPSNNIFYASKAGDGAGYNHYKILMTNNPGFVQDQGKIPTPNSANDQINRIQKKRRIQAM